MMTTRSTKAIGKAVNGGGMAQWSTKQIRTAWTQLNVSLVCLVVSGILLGKLVGHVWSFWTEHPGQANFNSDVLWYLLAIPCGLISILSMIRSVKICFSWDEKPRQKPTSEEKS